LHCRTLKDTSSLMALKTDEENRASLEYERTGKYRADVNACIKLYDAKAIAANHETAVVYCVQASADKNGLHNLLNLCMHKHDMVTAMCMQDFDFMTAM